MLIKPYADATGTDLAEPGWDGSLESLKALEAAQKLDLILADGPTLAAACRAQLVEKLDWNALGREHFLPEAVSDCGAGATISATLLAWDRDKLAGVPNWGDFWDVTRHPGRRGLERGARGNLEIALLADGVSPGDVYRTLRTPDGQDRAFRKLDQLKPYIEWWQLPSQPGQLLTTAKVLMTTSPSFAVPNGAKIHVGTQWQGSLSSVSFWAVAAHAGHAQAALAAIGIATDAARQALLAKATGLGPTTLAGVALLPEPVRAGSPSTPAKLQGALAIDDVFWEEQGDKMGARFAAWLGK
jgi:putative spermidine/putrescine transport system substrate-binding protein